MNKGSTALLAVLTAVGGFAVGRITSDGGDAEVVEQVELEEGSAALGAAPTDDVERFRVPVDGQPQEGPSDALVTMVVFSEFECPFCSRVLPTVEQLKRDYGDDLRVVWRNNPLPMHRNAVPAAQLALEAFEQGGDEKFWEIHDVLFENQRALGRAELERYAQQAGLNMDEVRAALDNNEHAAAIEADQQLANQVGARGTPNFFINGENLRGAQPVDAFKAVIDRQLAAARASVEAGTPRSSVYATLIQNGRTAPAAAPAQQQQRQARPQPDPAAVYRLELPEGMLLPQKGPDNALVTIVEFSDFDCPFCSRVNPTIDSIMEEYGDDVRVIWMNNPLPMHPNAGPAAQAALEAYEQGGNEKFWAMHDILFENQRQLGRENLESFAQRLGLNMAQFRAALDNNEHQEAITQQQAIASRFGARGTPSFFINGRNLRGAQPLAGFKAVIDEELARARELISNGTPRAGVYAAAVADGATSPQMLPAPGGDAAPARPAAPPADQRYEIAVPRNAPFKGGANAQVVIQEFSDFECPFCVRVNPTIAQILETYGDRVKIVWRNYPLPMHQNAPLAAEASLEVFRQRGNDGFWQYHDILFQNQRAMTRENLETYAQQIQGINMAQFRSALDSRRHQASVEADMAAVSEAGARIGTPSFFINGRLVQGAQPFPAFQAAIDAALAE